MAKKGLTWKQYSKKHKIKTPRKGQSMSSFMQHGRTKKRRIKKR